MRLYIFEESILIFAHLEGIRLFLFATERSSAVRADSALCLRVRKERFAGNAIPALIRALVNVTLIIELFENLLNGFDVVLVRCADEAVIIHTEKLPYFFYLRRDTVNILLRGDSACVCKIFDLLTMLIRACAEENVIPLRLFIARDGVRKDGVI